MFNKFLSKKGNRVPRVFLLLLLLVAMVLATTQCSSSGETEEPEQAAETNETGDAAETAEDSAANITLAIEHFSVIEGTTWSGAHDRAGERLAEEYDNVDYVFREEVGPDVAVPYAEELISDGANIVIGNAEFMGLPLEEIADKYPDVYFGSIIASDLST